jgi:hypothetical protein
VTAVALEQALPRTVWDGDLVPVRVAERLAVPVCVSVGVCVGWCERDL